MPLYHRNEDIDYDTLIKRGIQLEITVEDDELALTDDFEAVIFDRGTGTKIANMGVVIAIATYVVVFSLSSAATTALAANQNAYYNIKQKKAGADWDSYMEGRIPIYDYGGVS